MKSDDAITVQLDGQAHVVAEGSSLASLLASLGYQPNAVATALNGQFVARGERDKHPLRNGDAVLLFQPIVGG